MARIETNNAHTSTKITQTTTEKLKKDLKNNTIVVIAGFQDINNRSITTLGRGESDTSAVTIAAALNAHECQIFTDVEGVYTTDPIYNNGQKVDKMTYEEILEMSGLGSKVLQLRSIGANKYNGPVTCNTCSNLRCIRRIN